MKRFRFLFITQEDPFYVRLFFEEFLASYPRQDEIAGVVIAPTMGKKSLLQLVRQMYDFYGLRDFLVMGTRYVIYKIACRLGRIVPLGRFYSIAQVCAHYRVPVLTSAKVNHAEFLDRVRALEIDLIVSVAAPQVFKPALIDLPRLGCINIHNSRLPKYRGMLPNFWQMYHGEKSVGTTIHRINASLDDGKIIVQSDTPILPGESLHSLIERTKRAGAHLMRRAIEQLRDGTAVEIDNRKEEATYFTFPTRADVREFRRRGYRLI